MNSLSRRHFLASAGAGILGSAGLANRAANANTRVRNVVLILVDDLGWADVGCYGSRFHQTPHIDRLASEGMKFTNGYAACTVCSPTRASLLTGLYPARLQITDWIPGHSKADAPLVPPSFNQQLPHNHITIAEALQPSGYVSTSIGKWHLGGPDFYPETQGFAENVAGTHRGQPPRYFSPYDIPTLQDGPEDEFLTDRMAAEAISFMEENRDRPFFVYLPLFAVHTPIQAKEDKIARYRQRIQPGDDQRHPAYAAMVESVDEVVGQITDALDRLELSEDTVVIFTSDNGGQMLWGITSNYPLREGKGSSYEGGVRVPLIVRWPGVIEPGSTCDTPVISCDLMPTILEMTGASTRDILDFDGESLVPLLTREGELHRRAIYWHYPHYHPGGATPYGAIREGDWKLIEFYEDNRVELYNLREDIGETWNRAADFPEIRDHLQQSLHAWLQDINARMPRPNPEYGRP